MASREMIDVAHDGRDETEAERADRNFGELLQELRVAQTGVQILFAFLLTLPFTERFAHLGGEQDGIYLATLVSTALATVCLIAPVSHHRILFRNRRKPELVQVASRLAGLGLVFLWLSMVGAVFLIFDVVVGAGAGVTASAVLTLVFLAVWYVYPLLRTRRPARKG
jgi:O-antigen/teichoic acid export membrane protein